MIIDAHTHIRKGSRGPHCVKALVASMKKNGIDKAIVIADSHEDNCTNEQMFKAIAPYEGTLYAVVTLSPFLPLVGLRKFEGWLRERKIYGLKFYPGYEHFYPGDELFMSTFHPYLLLLQKYNRPVMFHSGDLLKNDPDSVKAKLKYARPIYIDDVAAEMPRLKIIICHMGWPFVTEAAAVCYKNKNVWTDLSGFVYGKFTPKDREDFQHYLGEFRRVCDDPRRLIFGTDYPVADDHESYLYSIRGLIPKKEHKLVFCRNAAKAFGVEEEFGLK